MRLADGCAGGICILTQHYGVMADAGDDWADRAKRSHWQLLYRMKRATVRSAMLLQSRLSEGDAIPGPFPT